MDALDSAASVYSEAKGEYTKQLTLFIVPVFHRFFMTCLAQAAAEEPLAKRQLWKFQELLSQIPEWNMDKVQREVAKLVGEIQCDYLDELLTAVFIAHTKVLTAIRVGRKSANKRVQITIPKLEHFLHRCLSESSRLLWSSAYLFYADLPPMEKQKNHRQVEQLLHDGIAQGIRGLLPVKSILKDSLPDPNEDDADDEKDEDDEKEEKEEKAEEKGDEKQKEEEPEKHEEKKQEETVEEKPLERVEAVVEAPAVKPVETPTVQPVIRIEEKPAEQPLIPVLDLKPPTAPAPPPAVVKTAEPPRLVVETEPSVQFTDFNQVIQERGAETQINYVETSHEPPPDDEIAFLDGEDEPLSDFEDITEVKDEPMGNDDFETLP